MSDFFDKALHYMGQNKQENDIFVLNIGSMDGILFDEMCGYTHIYDFKGLYVEPIPYLFERLKNNININDNLFENSAIAEYNGEIEMIMIDRKPIDDGTIHNCFYGMSAVYPPRNGLKGEGDKEIVDKYGIIIKVPCITFESLMSKHNILHFDVVKMDAEGYDYKIFKQIDLEKYKPSVVRLEWINLTDDEKKAVTDIFNKYNYIYEISSQDITALSKSIKDKLDLFDKDKLDLFDKDKLDLCDEIKLNQENKNITFVTGLWDIGRSNLSNGWSRHYTDYLNNFSKLLECDINLIVFGDSELEQFVFQRRNEKNTLFVLRDLNWFVKNEYYEKIQKIRTDPKWYNQTGWLKDSTQAQLNMYNPIVMSKMFLLNDAQILDKFSSNYMFWIDAGITFTVHPGYFTHDMVQFKLQKYINKFTFITFPYNTSSEIHGFNYDKMCDYLTDSSKINKVARGGFFGGPKKTISQINAIYYDLLIDTLSNGLMGTEESLFSIILYKYANITNYIEILEDGMLYKFFEDLKNDNIVVKSMNGNIAIKKDLSEIITNLYVLTYNFPDQFEHLLKSFEKSDNNFLTKTKKYLLNNSTDETTFSKYTELCEKYGFEQIKKNNIGICGGRQYIAEHFDNSDAEYYIFFEDDMLLHSFNNEICDSGFRKYVSNLYDKSLNIMHKENYDFLKLNFTELYGSNNVQWAWYNVPEDVRIMYFPDKIHKPKIGLDPNPPYTQFTNIKKYEDITYIEGDIYYCNWPLWFNKIGNKKVFLEPKYDHPYEQTWMSLIFQKQKQKIMKVAALLLSPINHNRICYYKADERRES